MMDGWASYGMTPEQVTAEWKKARETLWKQAVSGEYKGDGLPRSYTTQYKKVFMGQQPMVPAGTEFVYVDLRTGDPDPDNARTADVGEAWQLSPFQDEAKWRWAIVERPPTCEGERQLLAEGIEQLINYRIGHYADIWSDRAIDSWGWSAELALRFQCYLLGECYQPEHYLFSGFRVNPWVSPSIQFKLWLGSVSGWMHGSNCAERSLVIEFADYWFSMLPYVHPAFFSGKVREVGGELSDEYLEVVNSIRQLKPNESGWPEWAEIGRPISEQGKQNRRVFFEYLQERVLRLQEHHPFRQLWVENIEQVEVIPWQKDAWAHFPKLAPEKDAEHIDFARRYSGLILDDKFVPPYFGNSVKEQGE